MARYQYTPLPTTPSRDSIRLAAIRPGICTDDVVVDLLIQSFTAQSPPTYEALSYVWGSTELFEVIYVGKPNEQRPADKAALPVTRSLKAALQHLRYPDQERIMWIDAICIDQSNNIEKGPQVAMMGKLFECASRVVVWLGSEEDESGKAMERLSFFGSQIDVNWGGIHLITPAANVEHVDCSIADPSTDLPMDDDQWLAVISLLHRSWFDRLWVRQEILVAEDKAIVYCGPHQISCHFAFPDLGTLEVLGVSSTTVQKTQPIPKFYGRDWAEGVEFLKSIAADINLETSYPSGGTLLRALARTILYGLISDFSFFKDGNFPTTEIAEAVFTRFVSGVGLVKEDYNMGSDAQRFLKRMDWGSGEKKFIWGSDGYVGVAPPSIEVGDEVFVVVGCQQPLVLRRNLDRDNCYSLVGECYVEGCARGEPLLGSLPDHIGFEMIINNETWRARKRPSRSFRDLRSGEPFGEDPRLKSLGVELHDFRGRLAEDPEAILSVAPEVLMERIRGLRYINLV
ncbi:hypothetical protein Daus18300_010488 [Diaporthe australafricana]|uniref:Heterokaryon incompatibility domain-containing protein n=1 Tax=Diaporthe australafricana TaxID=127596 RepID=A0ABR3WA69_9PEZI